MKLYEIDLEIRKVCPHIHGVHSTGKIDFSSEASEVQKEAATSLMAELLPTFTPEISFLP